MENIITLLFALVITLVLTPILRKMAIAVQLVDKPNQRKVHQNAVPLVGGIVIFIATVTVSFIANSNWSDLNFLKMLMLGALVLLVVGVIDDKMNIRASFKLLIQLLLAHYVFVNGVGITSFYGILGIYELPIFLQYSLTLIVITGCINAFNLMDGIDGLAAGLAIVALGLFAYLAFKLGNSFLLLMYLSLIGSLVGFLRFNLSKKQKVFMGDAGSLFIGFILVVSGIFMIQMAEQTTQQLPLTLSIVIGVLALPVIDSLRVYRRRIKTGYSPFKADKSHLHHLVLLLGIPHKYSSLLIVGVSLVIIVLNILFGNYFGITYSLLIVLLFFILLTTVLRINQDVKTWREKIRKLEEGQLP
ncbi:undecaprenyl-phosphate alpha-N-acetylglucosaminyl 1-phosphate transferase [Marivirga lumbricoides]|uniref:Undecaprenyl-phosphate alpha-N-acetylglucosaminyl 1-phosphate transferase n=1 Tax=Marivirga lumbricoides TaxID=1046115 RepID=A0A2T4DNG4_9BACT|nr:hypothetical protein C9994_11415 [Marivirga lumbricoides]GGC47796.1 undecaprenyl-phosphate alpha-N-acetylglucosaminyl 1-phosphate transferase [Marivirga lumbricoides]